MNISIDKKVEETLVQAGCEWLPKDLWKMLKECNMQDGNYKVKLDIMPSEFGNTSTANLLVIDDGMIILTKTYMFSKLDKSLEFKYSNYQLK